MDDKKRLELVWKLELIRCTIGITYTITLILYLIASISKQFSDSTVTMFFEAFIFFLYLYMLSWIIYSKQYRKLPGPMQLEIDFRKYPGMRECYEVEALVNSYIDKPIVDLLERCKSYANVEEGNNVLVLHNQYRYQITLRFNDTILSVEDLPERYLILKYKNVPYKETIEIEDFRNPI